MDSDDSKDEEGSSDSKSEDDESGETSSDSPNDDVQAPASGWFEKAGFPDEVREDDESVR